MLVIAFLLVGTAACSSNPFDGGANGAGAAAADRLAASGTIEADTVRITTQVGGRIESLTVDEGDEIVPDQVVVHLDEALLQSDLKQAQAALVGAQAQLAQVKAGARAADIRKLEAALTMAGAARDGALVALEDAKAARANPQDMSLKINAAQIQVAIADQKLAQATANQEAAQIEADMWQRTANQVNQSHTVCVGGSCQTFGADDEAKQQIAFQWNLASQRLAAAWDSMGIARTALETVNANLATLQAQAGNPLLANSQVDSAAFLVQAAVAGVGEAEATLALAKAGASAEQVAVAEAGVRQAETAVKAIQVRLDKMTLRAPSGGLVTARGAQQGEMAMPGVSLLTVANLDEVRLTLYIPEAQIARVKTGQKVSVRVDSFPGRVFDGQVTFIAPQAEFTPRTTQTQDERAKLVFAIKVTITNADHALKPGMFADAEIAE
jgi:multidrug efflux pump subunit AcrA (membrane-fusion protein)